MFNHRPRGTWHGAAAIWIILLWCLCFSASAQTASVVLAWDPSSDPGITGYGIYYGGSSGAYTNRVSVGNTNSVAVTGLTPGATYYFAATVFNSAGLESEFSNEVSYTVPVVVVTRPPTLNLISNVSVSENSSTIRVNLAGITPGVTTQTSTLKLSATTDNSNLIPSIAVGYRHPSTIGTLSFTPRPNTYGTAIVTVTADNGATSNNITTRQFTVTVTGKSQLPTMDAIADVTVYENSTNIIVELTGISPGTTSQGSPLTISAESGNHLVQAIAVDYASPSATGILRFTPKANAYGTTVVTVTVTAGGNPNLTAVRQFTVNVSPFEVTLGSSAVQAGNSGSIPLNFLSTESVVEFEVDLFIPAGILSNVQVQSLALEIDASASKLSITPGTASTLRFKTKAGKVLSGSMKVADITFSAGKNTRSGFIKSTIQRFTASLATLDVLTTTPHMSTTVVFINNEPLLVGEMDPTGARTLTLFGKPAARYAIEYATSLHTPIQWTRLPYTVPLTNSSAVVSGVEPTPPIVIYRAVQL